MSSSGVRAAGTDGTDFQHRERVASQYADSAKLKPRLRVLLTVHSLLCGLVALSVGTQCYSVNWQLTWRLPSSRSGLDADWLAKLTSHFSSQLELVYITSVLGVLLAFAALKRNDAGRMRMATAVGVITAVAPAALLVITEMTLFNLGDVMQNVSFR